MSLASVILTAEEEQELFNNVGSQEINMLLDGRLDYWDPNSESFSTGNQNATLTTEENTMAVEDVKFPPHEFPLFPIPVTQVLSNEEYEGPYGFDVGVLPNYQHTRNPWVYSPVLNKAYMDMNQQFPVDFKLKNRPPDQRLFVRVTPQYVQQNFAAEAVCRCIQHDHHSDPTNQDVGENVRQHVIRCANSLACYLGNPKIGQRLSVVLPLGNPQAGSESVREFFQFVCKSSCGVPGMNRRGIEVIFTLENEQGQVVGRNSLKVRICACPKRDKEKDEKEADTINHKAPPKGKKRKVDQTNSKGEKVVSQDDPNTYQITLNCVGKQNLFKVLSAVEDIHTADLYRAQGNPEMCEKIKKCVKEVQECKRKFSSPFSPIML